MSGLYIKVDLGSEESWIEENLARHSGSGRQWLGYRCSVQHLKAHPSEGIGGMY